MTAITSPRDRALERANVVRTTRANLKHKLRDMTNQEGRLLVADLLDDGPAWLASMEVWTLLMAVWQMKRDTARSMLRVTKVMPKLGGRLTVADLSVRQRAVLSGLLRARAGVE